MKIVVVSPHRDDAAFSLGLAIDHWLASGHQVTVLNCFTQSDYAPFSDVESLHANDRVSFVSAVRRREDVVWGKLAGARLLFHDLDLLDAPLRLACPVEELQALEVRPGDRAVARVAGALAKLARRAEGNATALAVPLAIGAHIDLRVVRQAALEALTDPAIPLAFYEDLPYAARPGAVETLTALTEGTRPDLQEVFASGPRPQPDVAVQRKARLAECYDSQIDSDTVRLIAEFCRPYGGRERLWANPAFAASALCSHAEEQG